jgi:APA family basic amino acid/polyamine antiporter
MDKPDEQGKNKVGLSRQLGLFDSTMVLVGIVIGSGIFLTTGIMAKHIPSPGMILIAWIVGGLLTLAGALTYAELGAAMPKAGGQYVYIREAYGPLPGFLFGWILFLVYMTGGIAGLALAFSLYFGRLFPSLSTDTILLSQTFKVFSLSIKYSLSAGQVVGVIVIVVLSIFNYIGLAFGKFIQNIFTVLKIGSIIAIITLGFTIGKGTAVNLSLNPTGISFSQLIFGFGVALIAVIWAFDGWNNMNFVAGEIKNPQRNIPLALILGTLGITVLYVLVNYIYLYALPIPEMAGVERIAEKASSALFGASSGSINGSILAGPRVYYAMARDKLFFQRVSNVHPRFRTPGFAILIQAIWASILALIGTFEQMFTFAMFIAIIFWIAAAASVFTLRKKFPDLPRPYKTWGYPVVPIIFILTSFCILLNTLIQKPVESLAGLGFTALGIPVYFYWRRKGRQDLDKSHPQEN